MINFIYSSLSLCIHEWNNGKDNGHSCLWFNTQVIWTEWLSYYIFLQKGFYDSYRPPKALSVVADCLLCSCPFLRSITACCAICSHIFTETLPWCWSKRRDDSGVHIKCVEEEGAVHLYEIFHFHASHLCLHVKTIEGDFNTCQHWAYQLNQYLRWGQGVGLLYSFIYFHISSGNSYVLS